MTTNLYPNYKQHIIKIVETLKAHKFYKQGIQEILDTLKGMPTNNIHLLNKEEAQLVSSMNTIREKTTFEAFKMYINNIFYKDNKLYENMCSAIIKEKNYNIKLLEIAITNSNLSEEKIKKLEGNIFNSINILKAFAMVLHGGEHISIKK